MAEKDVIIKERLDHSGIFSFSEFYAYAHDWLKEEQYGVVEEKYSERVSEKGRDIDLEWKAMKKISDYFKIEHSIKMNIKGLIDVEVEMGGKKKRMNKGSIAMEIKGILVKDYESKWDTNAFYRFLRDTYNKYIIANRVDAMEDKVAGDVRTFKEEIKTFLELSGKR